ncbi:OmpA family protein [Vibrio astriarenae]|uniref:OmpA family protein n=1 Tax=Vibrio astriarenae TaxID=1481923 RepID=A0A7Z2T580_9VIBR|nr:OmpA family protein [Vibrio astriarenae]QIA64551.1 OmpA family protein [Vibrio astriarenae]
MTFFRLLTVGVFVLPTTLLAQVMQKPLDLVEWRFAGDRFQCHMETPLKFDGHARINVQSGKTPELLIETFQRPAAFDSAWLSINDEVWRVNAEVERWLDGDAKGEFGVRFYDATAIKSLLTKMEQGSWAQVSVLDKQTGKPVSWDIPAVNFSHSLQEMKQCMANLLPMSFSQAQDNQFYFGTNGTQLRTADKRVLDDLAQYIRWDSSLTQILVDGHTDDQGHALSNIDLSRQRANQVRDYLVSQGVKGQKIQVRAHGQRFPQANNLDAEGRNKNRRVQVRLVQGGAS